MRALEFRLKQAQQPLTDAWQNLPIARRHSTLLGISFRPLQAESFGLNKRDTLQCAACLSISTHSSGSLLESDGA